MTRSTLILWLATAACALDERTVEQPQITSNQITSNQITSNAIASGAIASSTIAAVALGKAMWPTGAMVTNSTLRVALEDPEARVFMKYLVGCALDPDQQLMWENHDGSLVETWTGSLGLCPRWQTMRPDRGCRERVSSCILARNNQFGIPVQIAMRGHGPIAPLPLGRGIGAHGFVPQTKDAVPSLEACPGPMFGPGRNCGWEVASIGVCVPGTRVVIGAGNSVDCAQSEWLGTAGKVDGMLRVCAGTSACDRLSHAEIESVDDACFALEPLVDFTCPTEGLYAVMTAAYDSTRTPEGAIGSTMIDTKRCAHEATVIGGSLSSGCSPCTAAVCELDKTCCSNGWDATCVKLANDVCRYPAPETRIYRWREGSFYGDLFGAANLEPTKPEIFVDPKDNYKVKSRIGNDIYDDGGQRSRDFIGVAFPNMFACSSRNWDEYTAYFERRVCAGPDPTTGLYTRDCAAQFVDHCDQACDRLDDLPVAGDHDAADCRDLTGRTWAHPMTTLLAQPCDAVPGPCTTVSSVPDVE